MNQAGLFTLLKKSGLPVSYRKWTTPPAGPYLVYLYTRSSDLIADGYNYANVDNWQVELYTSKNKDPASEAAIEKVFRDARIPFEKVETYLDTEDMNQVVYIIRTI